MNIEGAYFYPGSRPFEDTDIDRKLFFGRDREKEDLLQKVLARKLVVLFAKSGLGKTSLINAGVNELLREKGCVPLKVRFNHTETNPVQTVYNSIKDRVEQLGLDWEPGEEKTLWQYFKTAAFWSGGDSLMTPVLILDQFEEFFAFHEPEARKAFILQLADLVNGTIPSHLRQAIREGEPFPYGENPPGVKVLVSIREDHLGLLEEFSPEIPDILRNRYRLSALTRDQAREAIIKPPQVEDERLRSAGFQYEDDALNAMLGYLSKGKERSGEVTRDEIESFQLQLLCRHIESNIRAKMVEGTGADGFVVKEEDLGGEPGMQKVLQNFYEKQLAGLKSFLKKQRVRRLCESGLISTSSRRLSLEEEEIERRFKVSPPLLAQLVDNRLLRAEKRVGSVYYELSHDTLVTPIRLSQRKRRTTIYKYTLIFLLLVLIPVVTITKYALLFLLLALIAVIFVYLLRVGESLQQDEINKLFKEAQEFLFNSDENKAIKKYYKILEIDNKNIMATVEFGRLLSSKGKGKDAIAFYKKALDNGIKDARIYTGLGKLLFKTGEEKEAFGYLQQAIKINPVQTGAQEALGDHYAKKKEFKAAIGYYEKVLAINKKNWRAYEKLAVLYVEMGESSKAIEVFERAINEDAEFANIYEEIGSALKSKGEKAGLETLYGIALKVKSDDADYYFGIGYEYDESGRYDAAIASYKKALELKPDDADAHYNMGLELYNKGDYDAAIASYKKALALKPDDAAAHNNMGNALYNKGDYDAAIASYKEALKINPNYLLAKMNLALLYLTTERFGKALELANEVLKEKEVPVYDILAMKSISISSLFLQGIQSGALNELKKLMTYYRGLTKDYKRDWNYSPTKSFITQTKRLNEQDRALLLTLIDLLESSKKEGDKKLKELEKVVML
jgi:tetratricopeptide (TPR) repeat protein